MPFILVMMAADLASALLIVVFRRFAGPLGLLDNPGGRKRHEVPVPAVGGIAMFVAFAPLACANTPNGSGAFSLALALGLLVAVGLVDDKVQLTPKIRLVAEIAAGILMTHGWSVHYLGNLFGLGIIHTSVVDGAAFTLVCFVGSTNALNMADGLDGLAGSFSCIAVAWFTAIALAMNDTAIATVGATTLGVLAGFLAFNLRTPWRKRASIFMGDAGSMVLGFLLAWFAIELAGRGPDSLLTPIGAVWILAVPLLDMGTVMLYRMRYGLSPFRPDRRHVHYILFDRGVPVGSVVALLAWRG